ncbi:MAG: hypothetical protein L0Z62_39000 [Gemmataceae bacterium]|nr:hypothetical protein [Gemmataceae bacterium]
MTESEWTACQAPGPMLEFLSGRASARKLRLFACACCEYALDLGRDAPDDRSVEVARRYELAAARALLPQVVNSVRETCLWDALGGVLAADAGEAAREAARHATENYSWLGGMDYLDAWGQYHEWQSRTEPDFAGVLREIVGNPFRPVALDPAWRTPAVVPLAQAAYERALPSGRLDPARLAILADALEESGCTSAELLAHLRSGGEHVRGCWGLDLVLGRE